MLQQTQVDRVVPKYRAFLAAFPTVRSLARALPRDVLRLWQGLGYNRRALYLHRAAQEIVRAHKGRVPSEKSVLEALPGIGSYTAGAICAFAFNTPVVCIETNIRRVYLHHFFAQQVNVSDARLMPYIEATLDRTRPREWYWALMDYGATLPKVLKHNPNRRSRQYAKQSSFEGSDRKLRGAIVRFSLAGKRMTLSALSQELKASTPRIVRIVRQLRKEGFLS